MVSKATLNDRAELGANWLNGNDAARLISCGPQHLLRQIRPLLRHKSRSLKGRGARNVGYAYARFDVERVAAIRLALGCTALRAAQFLHDYRELSAREMTHVLEQQLRLELAEMKRTAPQDVDRKTRKNKRAHPLAGVGQ